jgi:lipopolysaccharide/colanic/teichoic acid biosynthesis glycosyltransferase
MPRLVERIIAFLFLVFSLPLLFSLWIAIKLEDEGPLIFRQKRAGKNKKSFTMFKLRTMVGGAEKLKKRYLQLNEADGPVFKIRDDPRYTKVGRFLAHTGLDELAQLVNIIKGEMSFIGPRPLPLDEAAKVPKKYEERFKVLPGITSLWVIKGSHKLSFDEWMKLDVFYTKKKSLLLDIKIALLTVFLILKSILIQTIKIFKVK